MRRVRLRHRYFLVAILAICAFYWVLNRSEHGAARQHQHVTEKSRLKRDYVLQQEREAVEHQVKVIVEAAANPILFFSKEEPLAGAKKAFLKTLRGKTPIFVYPPEVDNMISSRIRDYSTWEEDLLNATGKVFLEQPDFVFLDIGCNIGVYTLFMAKLGATVVAVDPVVDNLKLLSKSLRIGNLAQNVTLVNNAISDSRRNSSVVIPDKNVGGAYISDSETKTKSQPVQTIVLDDLAPILEDRKVFLKMDIEGHEYKALSSGHLFIQSADVRGILMEWVHHRYQDTGEKIISMLISNGLLPYEDAEKDKMLHPEKSHRWPENIFWMKR